MAGLISMFDDDIKRPPPPIMVESVKVLTGSVNTKNVLNSAALVTEKLPLNCAKTISPIFVYSLLSKETPVMLVSEDIVGVQVPDEVTGRSEMSDTIAVNLL